MTLFYYIIIFIYWGTFATLLLSALYFIIKCEMWNYKGGHLHDRTGDFE